MGLLDRLRRIFGAGRPESEPPGELIAPRARWEDLAIGEEALRTLNEVAAETRAASGAESRPGLGALFTGPSKAGNALAAEALAADLGADLYRVDLGAVVSKYIGETEKSLGRVFDRAEELDVVLLLDEGDALLSGRTDVRDSHDRYANQEVNFLLQRIEACNGLTIVATMSRNEAKLEELRKRLRYVVDLTRG